MQASGVTAQSSVTDLTALNAFDTATSRMTVACRSNDVRRCLCAGAAVVDRAVRDHPAPAPACQWQGGEVHRHVERRDLDVAVDARWRANVLLLGDLADMDRGAREPAIGDDQGRALYFGPVR